MINSTQTVSPPASGVPSGRILSLADDALLVSRLRRDAEAAGVDWRSAPLAASVIQRTSDQLFPSDQRCGESRARRIRGLVQSLPEALPERRSPEVKPPEDGRSPEVQDSPPEAPPSGDGQSPEGGAPEDQSAGGLRRLWRGATYRRAERSTPEPPALTPLPEALASGGLRPTGRLWAYAGALLGGVGSIAANVAHSFVGPEGAPSGWSPEPGAVIASAFWPVAVLVAVEILARVVWPSGARWIALRYVGLLPVALVAAFVSYRHLSGLLEHWGEDGATVAFGPLAVDGLMVMATGALIAIGSARKSALARRNATLQNG